MNQLKIFKLLKEQRKNGSHPLARTSKGYAENILTPVTLAGVVVPWTKKMMSDGRNSEYKLVCASGSEYFFVTDQEWREILSRHCWGDVKVKGLLNIANMTLIPQKVFPQGPDGQLENVIYLARNFGELVLAT